MLMCEYFKTGLLTKMQIAEDSSKCPLYYMSLMFRVQMIMNDIVKICPLT